MRLASIIREALSFMTAQREAKQPVKFSIRRCGCIFEGRERLVRCVKHTEE